VNAAEGPSEDVRRVLIRNDLLSMAEAADLAVGIVRQREALPRRTEDEKPLFALALERQIALADNDREDSWAIKSQAWNYAGVIVRFCDMIGFQIESPYTAEELHGKALQELVDNSGGVGVARLDKDLTLGVFNRYHAARNLRLAAWNLRLLGKQSEAQQKYDEALALVMRPQTELYGTGAEPHMAHYLYEVGAIYVLQGQAAELSDQLGEWEQYWELTRAAGYSTRYRFEFVRALAFWEENAADPRVRAQLDLALQRVCAGMQTAGAPDGPDGNEVVGELSVTLATAEYLSRRIQTGKDRDEALRMGRRALKTADDIRARWRVIARSRAPLALVFQRVHGDIARLAAELTGSGAARLGLRVALSAKQTGFAARIRAGRTLMNPLVEGLVEEVVAAEDAPSDDLIGNPESRKQQRLRQKRFELIEAVSPMLADTVLPPSANLAKLIKMIGSRYALDFLELPDTLDPTPKLYRTLIRPGGAMSFESFAPDAGLIDFFLQRRQRGDLADGLSREIEPPDTDGTERAVYGRPDWVGLGGAILPRALLDDLQRCADEPAELLISAHSWLSLLPWAALVVDSAGTRLVQRAVITQCPVLTCLYYPQTPPVRGAALIRLVGLDEEGGGVDIARERQAWGLGNSAAGVPLSSCQVEANQSPEEIPAGRLHAVLTQRGDWQFLHIACHGADRGGGLSQVLDIPAEPLWAGQALSLKWPTSVLMASCHVGQVVNDKDAEPLNLVMALLTGGARCVVAGIAAIDDRWTGEAASHMVRGMRSGTLRLDVALREAQLAAINEGAPEVGWALLSAYVQ
jgi:CHAT domain-containing protein